MEHKALNIQDSYNNNETKRTSARAILCPRCGNSVTLVFFGGGWVGTCCDMIVYNRNTLPDEG